MGARADRAWLAAMIAATAGAALVIAAVPYVPTNDGPQHVLSGHMQVHYADPDAPYPLYFTPQLQYAERGFATFFTALEPALGWRGALRAFWAAVVTLHAWGFALLARRLAPERAFLGLLGFVVAFSWPLYMGFFSFALGVAIGQVALVVALGEHPRRTPLVGVLLAVQAVTHLFTCAVTGVMVASILVARAPRERRAGAVAGVAAAAVFPLAVLAGVLIDHAPMAREGDLAQGFTRPLGDWLREVPRVLEPGPAARAGIVVLLVITALALAVARARAMPAGERVVAAAAAVALAIGLFAPLDVASWQFFAPRFVTLAASLALVLLPLERLGPRARAAAGVAACAAAAASLVATLGLHRRLRDGCADALAGLDEPLAWRGFTLPVPIDGTCGVARDERVSEVPELQPLFHMGSLYAAEHGGIVPRLLAGPASICAWAARPAEAAPPRPLVPARALLDAMRSEAFRASPAFHAGVIAKTANVARRYEQLVVFGAEPADADAFVARGFVPIFTRGRTFAATFRGCPLEIVLPKRDVRVAYGVAPLGEPTWRGGSGDAEPGPDGLPRLRVPFAMCGPSWVFVGGPDGKPACRNAGPAGAIVFDARGATELRCEE